jgi:hypothetical protein
MRTARRLVFTPVALAALAGALQAAAADGQAPSRQSFRGGFSSAESGAPTGFHEEIDYVNPEDPAGKPHAVQTIVVALADGARIDTSVPARCTASDAELELQGPSGCPAASRVGQGTVAVDTGMAVGTVPRVIENDATLFNADHELILFTESTNVPGPPIRSVGRSAVGERTFTTQAPALPGFPPPDPFTAIKTVRLTIDPVSQSGRAYLRTPATCPAAGSWINNATFTYRDGVSQRVDSSSTCVAGASPGGAGPGPRRRPAISLAGLRRGCASRDFTVRVSVRSGAALSRLLVRLDGRLVRATSSRRATVRIPARPLASGAHALLVRATDRDGASSVLRRRFARCGRVVRRPRFAG